MRYRFHLRSRVGRFGWYLLGHDLLLTRPLGTFQKVFLTCIPPSPSQGTIKEWILELPLTQTSSEADYLASLEDNLLVVIGFGIG